jgi:hypothetical protein
MLFDCPIHLDTLRIGQGHDAICRIPFDNSRGEPGILFQNTGNAATSIRVTAAFGSEDFDPRLHAAADAAKAELDQHLGG